MRAFAGAIALACAGALPGLSLAQVVISEIRIDQPGPDADEYLELAAPPGQGLDGLTYLVLGDGSGASGSGVIEAVIDLVGSAGPSGFFVVAEASFTLGAADQTATLNFENGDNVTHLLVAGFSGLPGDDLDPDDDGVLDVAPWLELVDAVALVQEENPPAGTELSYLLDQRVGPDGAGVPGHVVRCPDASGDFEIAAFDPAEGDDTPGAANACAPVLDPILLSIPDIQGAGHLSPFDGQLVRTTGVVTAVASDGYYLQDPAGDGDAATSDGIFVFTGGAPSVAEGDALEVLATVDEFTPGGMASGNLSITELVEPMHATLGTAPLPAAVVLGAGGRPPPTEIIDDDGLALFDPATDGLDFFESLEGMRVTVRKARAVSGTNRFGEIYAVADHGAGASGRSRRGTLNIGPGDFNPERIRIRAGGGILGGTAPRVEAGARLGDVTGVVGYSFGSFEVRITEPLVGLQPSRLRPERTWIWPAARRIRVASFNVLNLDPNDADGDRDVAQGRFDAVARIIAHSLRGPEIVALQEVQDDDGSATSGVTSAGETLAQLVGAIAAAGGPTYAHQDNPFIGNGTSGGQPGGNIRVAFLYDPQRVELVAGSVAAVVDPMEQQLDPSSPFFGTRPPLVARFRQGRATLTLVNVHLSSKGGSAPLFGRIQPAMLLQEEPAVNSGVDDRRRQARAVASFVDALLDADPTANVAVLGDFNEFEFVSPLRILARRLINLTWTLPVDERYSFVFEGNSQSLDHVLVSRSLERRALFDIVHVNSELAEMPARASDHDPVLARFFLKPSRLDRTIDR